MMITLTICDPINREIINPVKVNLNNVTYITRNYCYNLTDIYFVDGSKIIVLEDLEKIN